MFPFPFCPNPDCVWHSHAPDHPWFDRHGCYRTCVSGLVHRWRCRSCGRTFSDRTFHPAYHLKRPDLLQAVFLHTCEGMSGRAIGRTIGLSPQAVQNRVERLARQALALHQSLRTTAWSPEDVAIDGFVSFERSQYFPSDLTLSITARSRFILELSHASHKRSGAMTDTQKRRAQFLYAQAAFEPGAVRRSFRDILDSLRRERPPSDRRPLVLITDEKPEYRIELALHPLFRSQDQTHRIAHIRIPSTLPRTTHNPLFPSNYLDRELRKDLANQRRETTCFTRSVACGLSRLACYVAYHNYWKRFRIKARAADTRVHGELAGIPPKLLQEEKGRFFTYRAFLSRNSLSGPLERIWRMEAPTPGAAGSGRLPSFALE